MYLDYDLFVLYTTDIFLLDDLASHPVTRDTFIILLFLLPLARLASQPEPCSLACWCLHPSCGRAPELESYHP